MVLVGVWDLKKGRFDLSRLRFIVVLGILKGMEYR